MGLFAGFNPFSSTAEDGAWDRAGLEGGVDTAIANSATLTEIGDDFGIEPGAEPVGYVPGDLAPTR